MVAHSSIGVVVAVVVVDGLGLGGDTMFLCLQNLRTDGDSGDDETYIHLVLGLLSRILTHNTTHTHTYT